MLLDTQWVTEHLLQFGAIEIRVVATCACSTGTGDRSGVPLADDGSGTATVVEEGPRVRVVAADDGQVDGVLGGVAHQLVRGVAGADGR